MPQKTPFYSLSDVRLAVIAKQIFIEPKALTQSRELGYSLEAVLKILKHLEIKHYHKTYDYPERGFVLDAYRIKSLSELGHVDDIYIKFALRGAGKDRVLLVSFHLTN